MTFIIGALHIIMHVVTCVSSTSFPTLSLLCRHLSAGWPQWISPPCTLLPPPPPTSDVTASLSTTQSTTTTWCVPLWHPDAYPICCCFCIANVWLSLPLTTALYHFLGHYNYIISQYAQLMSVHNVLLSCCLSMHIFVSLLLLISYQLRVPPAVAVSLVPSIEFIVMYTIITINGSTS